MTLQISSIRFIHFICFVFLFCHLINAQDLSNIKNQKPVKFSSGLSVNIGGYTADGVSNRRMPFTWSVQGTPEVDIYGIRFPFLISFSNQQRSFHQPFNQFGVAPSYKWVKLHLGYSNVRFSNYTLAGRRFLGAGVELTPKNWRFGFVSGRFQKAIEFDSSAVRQSGIFPSNVPVPAFSRHGYALKVGYGGKKSFAEISFLKAKDNESSLQGNYNEVPNLMPAENAVLSLNTKVSLLKNLIWQMEVAASGYTRDLTSDTISLEKYPQIKRFISIITPRNSTQVFTAGDMSLAYQSKYVGLQARYKRVDADFKSMGAYFFETDLEQYSIVPSLRLFNSKVVLNGSIGIQKNNLLNARIHTTERIITSISGAFNPNTKFGTTFSVSNFGVTQLPNPNLIAIPTYDTLRLAQVARSILVSPFIRFGNSKLRQTITLSVNINQIESQNNSELSSMSGFKTVGGNLQYVLSDSQTKLNAQFGLNYQKVENVFLQSTNQGFNLGAGKSWKDITLNGNLAFFQNIIEGRGKGSSMQIGLNARYKLSKGINWNTRIGMTKASNTTQADFTEWFGNSGLTMRF